MSHLFDTLLIANRGEIAVRILRTAQALGIRCIAVYSEADKDALFVDLADQAVYLGPASAKDSYLNQDKIIAAAKATGAEAIHPGYGFLSENADFAERCAAEGLVFVGPPAAAIRAMGLKGEAKRLMEQAKVPVVPGYHGAAQDAETLAVEAARIGYPVLIKAVAGGGGKGMRQVHGESEFASALAAAQREGENAFGNPRVLIEKFIEKPRHIEIQVFADAHGHAVHLFERDCSLQRRHQKVVEEAPAPGMPAAMRETMGEAAVQAARAIGYRGAGTVEFIVDVAEGLDAAPFYFMEMNTRLQVEHPVTEMITGEDLVEWQLRVAAGEPLPLLQDDLAIDGHAFEVRLYAEDPDNQFLPATGTLTRFHTPSEHGFIRVDTGVRQGDAVTVHYDPMIAKLIAWGEDRATALKHLQQALAATEIAGFATNLGFLQRVAQHEAFARGDVDTGFIARHAETLLPGPQPAEPEILVLAVLGVLERRQARVRALAAVSPEPDSPWAAADGWRLNLAYREVLRFTDAAGTDHAVELEPAGEGYRLSLGDRSILAIPRYGDGQMIEAVIDGLSLRATVMAEEAQVTVILSGRTTRLIRHSPRLDAAEEAEGPGAVLAPMPGKILAVMVADGEAVDKGQPLLVMEAMKMEQTLTAPRAGTLARLTAKVGDQVTDGTVLAVVED